MLCALTFTKINLHWFKNRETLFIELMFFISLFVLLFLFYINMHVIQLLFKCVHVATLSLKTQSELWSQSLWQCGLDVWFLYFDCGLIKIHRWASESRSDSSLNAFVHFRFVIGKVNLMLWYIDIFLIIPIERRKFFLCKLCRAVPVLSVTFGADFVNDFFNDYILWMYRIIQFIDFHLYK